MEWFRFYTSTIHDTKIRRLPTSQRWLWVTVLTIASESPKPGYLLLSDPDSNNDETLQNVSCNITVTHEDLSDAARIDLEEVRNGIESFRRQKMLHIEDGVFVVTNWKKRQYVSDSSTDRVRKHRQNKKSGNNNETLHDEKVNVTETPPDTDTDTEIKEKRKKVHELINIHLPHGISSTALHDISQYMDKPIELELLNVAFRIAKQNDATEKGSYAASILRGFLNDNITTVAQYEAMETQRQTAAGGANRGQNQGHRGTIQATSAGPNGRRESITKGKFGAV